MCFGGGVGQVPGPRRRRGLTPRLADLGAWRRASPSLGPCPLGRGRPPRSRQMSPGRQCRVLARCAPARRRTSPASQRSAMSAFQTHSGSSGATRRSSSPASSTERMLTSRSSLDFPLWVRDGLRIWGLEWPARRPKTLGSGGFEAGRRALCLPHWRRQPRTHPARVAVGAGSSCTCGGSRAPRRRS